MKIINADVEFITPIDGAAILKHLEQCGRVCYKSEAKITKTSAPAFVGSIIKRFVIVEFPMRLCATDWLPIVRKALVIAITAKKALVRKLL